MKRRRPSLPVRMMVEGDGESGTVDVDCIHGYVCFLCCGVASGRRMTAYSDTTDPREKVENNS